MKRWLYVLQQRLAITNNEATALATISFLILLGLVVGEVRSRTAVFDDAVYAESDRVFRAGSAAPGGAFAVAVGADSSATDTTAGGKSAVASAEESPRAQHQGSATVDVNTAGSAQLQQLPRIGPKMAARIIAYREANGPFQRVEELENVRGIGPATLEKLRPHVMVRVPAE